jgi:NDP-sugar pyrophosphorylase family protein
MQCVILAGGLATRLGDMARDTPKHLQVVAGVPFAHHQLAWLRSEGVETVVYCIGHLGRPIIDFVGDGSAWGLRTAFSDEGDDRLGTGGAIRLAAERGLLDERFLVLYGDTLLDVDVRDVWRRFVGLGRPMLMTVIAASPALGEANCDVEGDRVIAYGKSGSRHTSTYSFIDYGLVAMTRSTILDHPASGRRFDLGEIQHAACARGDVTAHLATAPFHEIGTPDAVAATERHLRAQAG